MPYIKQEDRIRFDEVLVSISEELEKICTPGDLNYLITMICREYVRLKGKNYTHLNDVIGVLECAKQELYRRTVAPYEDQKIEENGDL